MNLSRLLFVFSRAEPKSFLVTSRKCRRNRVECSQVKPFHPGNSRLESTIFRKNFASNQRKRYARGQIYADVIWSRWLKEYVTFLNRTTKLPSLSNRDLKTGDLLWIVKPASPRGYFLLARVVKLIFGSYPDARWAEVPI